MSNLTMNLKDCTMLLLLSFLWGGSFIFNELALTDLPIFTVVFFRVFLAAFVLLLLNILVLKHSYKFSFKTWKTLLIVSIFNNIIPFSCILYAQVTINASLASILNATIPFFVVILAHFTTGDEKMSINKMLGLLFGFIGVICIIGFEALEALDEEIHAQFFMLLAAFSYAIANIYGKRISALKINSTQTATMQLMLSSLVLFIAMILFDVTWFTQVPSTKAVIGIIGLSVFCTAFAYLLFFAILKSAGATNVSLAAMLIPLSALILGIVFLDEMVTLNAIIGGLLIMFGILFIDGRVIKLILKK